MLPQTKKIFGISHLKNDQIQEIFATKSKNYVGESILAKKF